MLHITLLYNSVIQQVIAIPLYVIHLSYTFRMITFFEGLASTQIFSKEKGVTNNNILLANEHSASSLHTSRHGLQGLADMPEAFL